jgi:hypothetical protein
MEKNEMKIIGRMVREKADLRTLAGSMLPRIEAFFRDPENEKAFQEWKAERDKKRAAAS